jgi:hypothetical protein
MTAPALLGFDCGAAWAALAETVADESDVVVATVLGARARSARVRRWRVGLCGPALLLILSAMGRLPADAASGPPPERIRHMLHTAWQADAGLPENSVTAIQQTPDGYVWVGTQEGMARFDGVRFEVFTPANTPALDAPETRARALDHHGTL